MNGDAKRGSAEAEGRSEAVSTANGRGRGEAPRASPGIDVAFALAAVLCGGCGLDPFDEGPGGSQNLPTLGAGPYARFAADDATMADEPFVLFDRDAELFAPTVLAGGPGLRIWMSREVPGPPDDDTQIYYAELASVHDVPEDAPRLALAADQAWEQGRVASPTVVDLGGKHLVMFYEGGVMTRQIGRADSTDDGATWTKAAAPVLAGAMEPSAAYVNGRFELYVTRPGSPAIWRATGSSDGAFTFDAGPVLEPRPGLAKAFDANSLDEPDIVIDHESTRLHWGLYVVGYDAMPDDAGTAHPAIGYAGSFDGVSWERFGGAAAQLGAPAVGPAVLLTPAHGLMLYVDIKRGLRAIAAAHDP
jgi:hypothetical protein